MINFLKRKWFEFRVHKYELLAKNAEAEFKWYFARSNSYRELAVANENAGNFEYDNGVSINYYLSDQYYEYAEYYKKVQKHYLKKRSNAILKLSKFSKVC